MSEFKYEKIKDPGFFRENRLDAHSDHIAYASREEAEIYGESSLRESLNGIWKFHYAKTIASVIPGFEKEDCCVKAWDDIYVPAHIQMEGYDAPQYANVQYPWDGHDGIVPGEIPESFNPVASYVKYFHVPERMKGMPLFISFQGVESAFALWLNGAYVGYSGDTFTPSEFDLTGLLKEGENRLALQVFKWSAGSWLEDQDFYRFSGIFRDVYLYAKPKHHIEDIKIETVLSPDFGEGELTLSMKGRAEGGTVKVRLLEGGVSRGTLLCGEKECLGQRELPSEKEMAVSFAVENPALWSAEIPNLYQLEISVYDENGQLEEYISEKPGFRRFEMDGNIMKINGKRIVFKGVNRHEFSCDTGRVVSREEVIRDLTIMKQNNINAIRTCHYPDASMIYRLADEWGLYMIDECNMETHGSWDPVARGIAPEELALPSNHMEYLPMMLDRVHSMYERDKNHPAIVIWSCGNESYGGDVIYEMSAELRRLDASRLVHYEGVFNDRRRNETSDMESQMYTPAAGIEAFLAEHRDKPFICCEYTHAMGNSCGAMHKYTDLTDREPLYQGGFIWDFVDQSIRMKNRFGEEFQGYGGDNKERPTDYNFSGNGIVDGQRRISPKMQEVKYNYQNLSIQVEKDSFTVTNKNLFVNTDAFLCCVTLSRNGVEMKKAYAPTDTAPLSEKTYAVPFPAETAPGEYVVTVSFLLKEDTLWAGRGHEVAFGQGVYAVDGQKKEEKEPFTLTMGTYNVGVRGAHFEVLFSRLNGGLVSYKYAGREMIEAIPKPNFWRALTDNDCGNLLANRYGQWKLASLYATHHNPHDRKADAMLLNPSVEKLENSVKVLYTYFLPTTPEHTCTLGYEVFGSGRVQVTLTCEAAQGLPDMPECSVLFKLDADYSHMEWYGEGPDDCYCDRREGARLGIHKKTVEENAFHYLVPQESGSHTGIRWMKLMDHKKRGMLFTADGLEASVSPYTPHELENAMHPYELPAPHYTVIRIGRQMGVAGDDSWGARTHDEYLIKSSERQEIKFSFQGI